MEISDIIVFVREMFANHCHIVVDNSKDSKHYEGSWSFMSEKKAIEEYGDIYEVLNKIKHIPIWDRRAIDLLNYEDQKIVCKWFNNCWSESYNEYKKVPVVICNYAGSCVFRGFVSSHSLREYKYPVFDFRVASICNLLILVLTLLISMTSFEANNNLFFVVIPINAVQFWLTMYILSYEGHITDSRGIFAENKTKHVISIIIGCLLSILLGTCSFYFWERSLYPDSGISYAIGYSIIIGAYALISVLVPLKHWKFRKKTELISPF